MRTPSLFGFSPRHQINISETVSSVPSQNHTPSFDLYLPSEPLTPATRAETNSQTESNSQNDFLTTPVTKSWLRWPLLFLFVNCITLVSLLALCFSSASQTIALAYDVPLQFVAMSGLSFTVTYIPTTFASMYLYTKMKAHQVTRLACFIMFSGAWFRLLSAGTSRFWPIMSGQFWLSMACPLFFNMITLFCNEWFPDNERTLATAICGISIPLGNLLAFFMSGLMFRGIKESSPTEARHLVDRMIWVQNIWITIVTVPYFILLR